MCRWSSCRSPSQHRAAAGCWRSTAPRWSRSESRTNPDVARLFGSAWAAGMDLGPYMDTSPYVAEMSANKRSVGLELKLAEAAARRPWPCWPTPTCSSPTTRRRRCGPSGFATRTSSRSTRGIVYVALPGFGSDPSQPYYEFLAVGPEPGAARRPRRADRLPRPGAGGHRHDRPARLLRRAARARRRAHRAGAP